MATRQLNKVYTKEAARDVGSQKVLDVKFMPASIEEIKLLGEDLPDGYVAGWASTDDIDSIGDKVLPGAFDKALASRGLTGPKGIKFLVQHDAGKPAGIIKKLEQRANGLWIEAEMNLAISYVKDYYEAAKMQGGMNFSIGYRLVEDGFKFVDLEARGGQSYWELSEIDLHEVSAVTIPCNKEAMMTFIKDDNSVVFETMAEFEKALVATNAVQSRNEAKRWTHAVKRLLVKEHEKPPMSADTTKAMQNIGSALAELKTLLK